MARQIKNRREDLYINEVPPEIPGNLVTATSFASASKGGVIKVSTSQGINVSGSGNLIGYERSLENYNANTGNMIISKATLENVLMDVLKKVLIGSITLWNTYEAGTTFTFSIVKDEDGGGHWEYNPTSP